ncbi:MAG TPA: hypothetical protein VF618_09590 [Thermoanaerobaculia bacterium]
MKLFIAIVLLIALCAPLHAGVVCLNLPAESPVASNSPDDIPQTDVQIVTINGTTPRARANQSITYVETGQNEQRVWFGVDGSPGLYRIFYNRRVRDGVGLPWRWVYQRSPVVIQLPSPSSVLTQAVLYSATAKYRDTTDNVTYKYLMYLIYQPGAQPPAPSCDGQVAGFLYVSFSQNGTCWTTPRPATRPGGPQFACLPGVTNTVPILAASAIDGGQTIHLTGLEGDIVNQLANPANMDQTMTAFGTASVSDPATITILGTLSAAGLFLPQAPGIPSAGNRNRAYAYFINHQTAWDETTGDFYIARGYPWPFDRNAAAPLTPTLYQVEEQKLNGSLVRSCHGSPATLTNRIQLYRMNIGSLANVAQLATGTWTLVRDTGGTAGFHRTDRNSMMETITPTPLVPGQTAGSRDSGVASFLRDGRGFLRRYSGTAYYFGGDLYKLSKSGSAPCVITGNERQVLGSF